MFANLGQAIKVGMEENVVEHITWIFIGSGIFVFAVGFAGFLGAIRESKVMLGFVSSLPLQLLTYWITSSQSSSDMSITQLKFSIYAFCIHM